MTKTVQNDISEVARSCVATLQQTAYSLSIHHFCETYLLSESTTLDSSRFHGTGVNFKAKLIGIDQVGDARGDKMCQESIQTLKGLVRTAGVHKQRITVNVSLEGIKIMEDRAMVGVIKNK